MQIRGVLFEQDGWWGSQCLESNVVAQARTIVLEL